MYTYMQGAVPLVEVSFVESMELSSVLLALVDPRLVSGIGFDSHLGFHLLACRRPFSVSFALLLYPSWSFFGVSIYQVFFCIDPHCLRPKISIDFLCYVTSEACTYLVWKPYWFAMVSLT